MERNKGEREIKLEFLHVQRTRGKGRESEKGKRKEKKEKEEGVYFLGWGYVVLGSASGFGLGGGKETRGWRTGDPVLLPQPRANELYFFLPISQVPQTLPDSVTILYLLLLLLSNIRI